MVLEIPTFLIVLKDWIQVVTPITAALVVVFWHPLKGWVDRVFKERYLEPEEKQNSQIEAMADKLDQISTDVETAKKIYKALLHHEIFTTARSAVSRGFISTMELSNLDELYNAYHDQLGGNGTAQRLYEEAKKLEIRN